jgi:hypothetical protein
LSLFAPRKQRFFRGAKDDYGVLKLLLGSIRPDGLLRIFSGDIAAATHQRVRPRFDLFGDNMRVFRYHLRKAGYHFENCDRRR